MKVDVLLAIFKSPFLMPKREGTPECGVTLDCPKTYSESTHVYNNKTSAP